MRLALVPTLAASLACACASATHDGASSAVSNPSPSSAGPRRLGTIVSELGERLWVGLHDSRGRRWFGSDGEGLYCVEASAIVRYTTADGLCDDRVRQILEDASGNVFVNTLGGISAFDGERFTTLVPVEGGRSAEAWRSRPGDLWFAGRQEDDGPYRYDGATLHRLALPESPLEAEFRARFARVPFSPYGVYTIARDDAGALWFGTSSFGACRFDGRSFTWIDDPELVEIDEGASFGVRAIVQDREGAFWFSNLLHRYEVPPVGDAPPAADGAYRKRPGLVDPGRVDPGREFDGNAYFMSGLRDARGDVWIATLRAGVWRWDGRELSNYPVEEHGATVSIYSLYADRQGVLWLGTPRSGAWRLDGGSFVRFRP